MKIQIGNVVRDMTPEEESEFLAQIAPPPPLEPVIPSKVTMRQARLQLAALGVYQTVNNAVASMGDTAQIEWEYAIDVERSNAITQAIITLLGWTEAETDAYFTAANLL